MKRLLYPILWIFAFALVQRADSRVVLAVSPSLPNSALSTAANQQPDVTPAGLLVGDGDPFPVTIPLATDAMGAHSVNAADLDRDGDLDVIAASRGDGKVVWHKNLGGQPARFAVQTLTVAPGVYVAIPADLNRDGWPDILIAAVTNLDPSAAGVDSQQAVTGAGKILWLENRLKIGQGFQLRSVAEGLNYPVAVLAVDLDRDGDLDILSATRDDGRITWYENRSNGAVFVARLVADGLIGSVAVAAGDIDGDGSLDVIAAIEDNNQIFWFRNNGATVPGFAPRLVRDGPPPPTGLDYAKAVVGADVDGDGDLDIGFASEQQNQVGWYENQSRGATWVEHLVATDALHAKNIFAADMDLDGDIDLLAAASESGVVAFYENKEGTPPTFKTHVINNAALGARSVYAADIDGNGTMDILSASRDDNRILFYPNMSSHRTALFDAQKQYIVTTYRESRMATAADIDEDGDPDILSIADGVVAWHRNNGGTPPTFTPFVVDDQVAGGRWVQAADIDGDGDLDILSADTQLNRIKWYENQRVNPGDTPTFLPRIVTDNAPGVRDVYAADLDGDGDLDLYSASDSDNTVVWYEQKHAASIVFERHVVTDNARYARSSFAADLDGDGDLDLMSASADDNVVAWYENRGGTPLQWTPHVLTQAALGARHVYADDLDGDGDIDIVGASELDNTIAWFENRGTQGGFVEHPITVAATGVHAVVTGDADQDGDVDIFAALEGSAKIVWYENDGAALPIFAERTIATNFQIAHSVAVSDVDGDGDLDVIATSRSGGQVAWFENVGGQYNVTQLNGEVSNSALQVMTNLVFVHRGRAGDPLMRLSALTIRFTAAGQPLTPGQATNLFTHLHVYQDSNGNGIYDADLDALIITVDSLNLDANGQLLIQLPNIGAPVVIAPGATNRYIVVAESGGSGCLPAGSVQVTHVANAMTALNATTGYPMRAEYMRGLDGVATPEDTFQPIVLINEIMADNTQTLEDPDEPLEYPDWIELYNPSAVRLNLGGMFLTDDAAQPKLFQIPDGVMLPPLGYTLFIADGEPEQGPRHTNFRLSKSGETIALFDKAERGLRLLDQVTYDGLGADVSFGRFPSGSKSWLTLGAATPNSYNLDQPLVIAMQFYMPFVANGSTCQ